MIIGLLILVIISSYLLTLITAFNIIDHIMKVR